MGQQQIGRARGHVLNTFQNDIGDAATGNLRSRPFTLSGDLVELWVAGGHNDEKLRVSLLVEGVERFRATGCESELLGRRLRAGLQR